MKMIEEIDKMLSGESKEEETENLISDDIEKFMEKLTPENIDTYAYPIESTRQTVKPDAEDLLYISYELEGGAGSEGFVSMETIFPERKVGMSKVFDYSCSGDEVESLLIDTYTLNEDGTVTFVAYAPKKNEK